MEETTSLRSQRWFGGRDKQGFLHRAIQRALGLPDHAFDGRPIIGVCNTWSEFNPCNGGLRELADYVKRGVWEAGGVPLEFSVLSPGEDTMRPTAMLYRNLAAIEVEEMLRSNPIDGVVLLAGCDKTTPSLLMGAATVNLPTIVCSTGPQLSGRFQGRPVGASDAWRLSEERKAGTLSADDYQEAERAFSRSVGTCQTMGTAATMASICEAMGVALPQNAAIPAVDARRKVLAHNSGVQIVEMVRKGLTLSRFLTEQAFFDAIRTVAALGGSTNAVIHLIAIARRLGVPLSLDDWDRLGKNIPCIVDIQPAGRYLMEEFFDAGGLPVVMQTLLEKGLIDGERSTVSGRTIGEQCRSAVNYRPDVIRPYDDPVTPDGGIAVLRGNLAPSGAVIKPAAATRALLKTRGRAVTFENMDDYRARIDDLDVDVSSVLVLKNCGPRGYPGMPEVGNFGLPPKLLKKGVRDMVRISDARMSGTAYGTIVLHVAPEAAVGGNLALVEDGDLIELDVDARILNLAVDEAVLEERRRKRKGQAPAVAEAGYARLFESQVTQADEGCDFGFLQGPRPALDELTSY